MESSVAKSKAHAPQKTNCVTLTNITVYEVTASFCVSIFICHLTPWLVRKYTSITIR